MKFSDLQYRFKLYCLNELGMTKKNHRSIERHIERLLEYLQTDRLFNITSDQIRDYIMEMKQRKSWSARTIRSHLQSFRSYYHWGLKRGFTKKNPAEEIEKPKVPLQLPRCLTREEAEKILAYCSICEWHNSFAETRNYLILKTFLLTGLRLNELLNLQHQDVNLETKSIHVRQGKGNKDRKVPIHPSLEVDLRSYYSMLKKKKKYSKWVFPSIHTEKKLYERDVRAVCQRVSLRSGIYFTPHMLRHTFARLAVDADLNLYKLKEILGHTNISTTQIYMSVSDKALNKGFGNVELL
ncbi:MAG: tyrosine-type recombinase/integrase [Candidatus Gracilibacteria bacterium]|nr:tyrosine-type recombinase/integrase [Candidatus Gracilibacteria bacterium]